MKTFTRKHLKERCEWSASLVICQINLADRTSLPGAIAHCRGRRATAMFTEIKRPRERLLPNSLNKKRTWKHPPVGLVVHHRASLVQLFSISIWQESAAQDADSALGQRRATLAQSWVGVLQRSSVVTGSCWLTQTVLCDWPLMITTPCAQKGLDTK